MLKEDKNVFIGRPIQRIFLRLKGTAKDTPCSIELINKEKKLNKTPTISYLIGNFKIGKSFL
jgi:hypothetical protein